MKKFISLIIALSCFCTIYGQLDFAPLGAKWYTRQDCPALPMTFYGIFTVTQDSIIEGKYCTRLGNGDWPCYSDIDNRTFVHQEGYQVYRFDFDDQEFQLIYDFSKQVGESWKVKVCPEVYGTDTLIVFITEAGGIHRSAKIIHLDSTVLYDNISLGEGYGTTFGSGKLLLPSPVIAEPPCTDELICYEDPELGFIYSIDNCVNTSVNQPAISEAKLTIFPNPTQQESTLLYEFPIGSQGEVFIFDSSGRKLSQIPLKQAAGSLTLPVYPPGMYFVVLFVEGRMVLSSKFLRV